MSEKVQKVLARAGLGSRRQIEQWIEDGRIKINQQTAKLGDRIEVGDRVQLDGKYLSAKRLYAEQRLVLMYHKDVGTVCTRSDPEGRKTVFTDFPKLPAGRWVLVGRLDISTSGLLLATTDGELANRLMHPSYGMEREYVVRILGQVDQAKLERLLQGVELEDGMANFETIEDMGGEGANHWYRVVVKEGRNREVRRLWESQGVQVSRLTRVRFGPIAMPKALRRGQSRELTDQQMGLLCASVGLEHSPQTGREPRPKHSRGTINKNKANKKAIWNKARSKYKTKRDKF